MRPGIEVWKLIDAIENVGDELLQEDSWNNADLAPKSAGDGRRQISDVAIVHHRSKPRLHAGPYSKQVAHLRSDLPQSLRRERGQSNLHRAGVVESSIRREVDVKPLGQRR